MTGAEWTRAKRAERAKASLCRCGRARVRNRQTCVLCLAWETGRRAKARAAGLCNTCRKRKAMAGARACRACREQLNLARREAMALYRAVFKGRP